MKEFKGTPGPWFVDANGVQARWNVDDANGNSVALTHQLPNDKDWSKRDSNTHLIAAAPELLEALQIICFYEDIPQGQRDIAEAAIAKALGN